LQRRSRRSRRGDRNEEDDNICRYDQRDGEERFVKQRRLTVEM
jgi:hypothetical protein